MQRGPAMPGKIEKAKAPQHALVRLLPYLNPHRLGLTAVLALVVVYTVLGLFGPFLMGRAIDQFIAGKDEPGLMRTALLMLGAYAFGNVFQVVANWMNRGCGVFATFCTCATQSSVTVAYVDTGDTYRYDESGALAEVDHHGFHGTRDCNSLLVPACPAGTETCRYVDLCTRP